MRRAMTLMVAIGLLAVSAAGAGVAQEGGLPDHPHMLLLGYEIGEVDGAPALVGWRRCVDLAGGHAVPLHAHHDHLHFGPVGDVLADRAGQAVVGGAPLSAWEGCAGLEAALPIVFG